MDSDTYNNYGEDRVIYFPDAKHNHPESILANTSAAWPRGYKTFFMLYSVHAQIWLFLGSDKPIMLFFLLINVKMPTIVGILTFLSRTISCSVELSMKSFITSGPDLCPHC